MCQCTMCTGLVYNIETLEIDNHLMTKLNHVHYLNGQASWTTLAAWPPTDDLCRTYNLDCRMGEVQRANLICDVIRNLLRLC